MLGLRYIRRLSLDNFLFNYYFQQDYLFGRESKVDTFHTVLLLGRGRLLEGEERDIGGDKNIPVKRRSGGGGER